VTGLQLNVFMVFMSCDFVKVCLRIRYVKWNKASVYELKQISPSEISVSLHLSSIIWTTVIGIGPQT